ncbi:MAG: hypothetical protein SPL22_05565 [Treponema sp.]|uniref:hypothetical protein n=1 Tax=Treponema sp. TaxID=166 RepID=UPI002A90DD74|nr:hypothetical protein [Treponema sp.]MDY6397180.1 hypothetical protein [Treponema sp.]
MKKFNTLSLALVSIAFVLTSCASTKISLQESSPVAVISIIGNTQVPWIDEDDETVLATDEPEAESLLTSMASRIIDSNNPEILTAVDRLDYAFDSANLNILEMTGCAVLPKEEVLSSEAYSYMTPSYFNSLTPTKTATGFKDLTTIGAKNARYLMDSIGAKSLLILSFTFQKDVVKGTKTNGAIGGVVTMKAKLLNNRGREVLNKIFVAKTSEPIKIMRGQYNKDSLVEQLENTIDDVMRQFCMELSKMSSDEPVLKESETTEIQATPIKLRTAE